ncbi:hypothetical protein EJ07DRAFT_154440 [Lizonia empirigonia]|nr:hypothetical protein EJ07DRAFT_154440 [Lizonia empirigonia]
MAFHPNPAIPIRQGHASQVSKFLRPNTQSSQRHPNTVPYLPRNTKQTHATYLMHTALLDTPAACHSHLASPWWWCEHSGSGGDRNVPRGTPHASCMLALGGILGPADGAVFAVLGDGSRGEDHGRAGFWGLDRLRTSRSRPRLQKVVVSQRGI